MALSRVQALDDIARQLAAWRSSAGNPSFSRIAERVAELRRSRGVHPRERSPGRTTVFDCFTPGRKRVDVDLLVDIAQTLGVDEDELYAWRLRCTLAQGASSPTLPAGRRLPARPEHFLGRDAQLDACLAASGPVLVLGMAGAGKSALAVEALRARVERGDASSVITVSLRADGAASSAAVLDTLARMLGSPWDDRDPGERARSIVATLRDRHVAVLLDDVMDAEAIRPLLDAGVSTPLVVTSRVDLDAEVERVPVEPWLHEETLALWRRMVGAERIDAEPEAARALSEFVGGLPLAATLTAVRLRDQRTWSLADHALRLRAGGLRLDEALHESIALSVAALSAPAYRMLRLISVQPCSVLLTSWAAALAGVPDVTSAELLEELVSARCIAVSPTMQAEDSAGIRIHALVRALGSERSWDEDPQSERDAAIDRLADAMLRNAWAATDVLHPGFLWRNRGGRTLEPVGDATRAAAFLDGALPAFLELAEAGLERAPRLTVEIGAVLGRHLDNTGQYRAGQVLHAQAVAAARQIQDPVGEAIAELDLGQNGVRLGRADARDHLDRAARLAAIADVPRVRMSADNALGILSAQSGDMDEALSRFRASLDEARAGGAVELIAPLTDNIAIILRQRGDLEGALVHHRAAQEDAQRRGDDGGAARTLANLSEVQLLLGDNVGARESAVRAGEIAETLGMAVTSAYATGNLGLALLAEGDANAALELFAQALDAARDMGSWSLEASVLNNIGEAYAPWDTGAALDAFVAADAIGVREGLSGERVRSLRGRGRLAIAAGRIDDARDLLAEAVGVLGDQASPEADALRAELAALGPRPADGRLSGD